MLAAAAAGFATPEAPTPSDTTTGDPGPVVVYLLAGQSNMVGPNPVSSLPEEWLAPQTDVRYAYWLPDVVVPQESGWEDLAPMKPGVGSGFGPELTFGRAMADFSALPVALIKCADNGSSLNAHWHPDAGDLYDGMVAFARARLADLTALGHEVVLGGFIWVQGSGDTWNTVSGSNYGPNLVDLAMALEADFGPMPFVQNQQSIHSGEYLGTYLPGLPLVRQGKVEHDGYLVQTDDLILRDNWHYDPASMLELGRRLATQAIRARADFDGNRIVDIDDFLGVLASWGPTAAPGAAGDVDFSGVVDIDDFLLVLAHWG